jgi:hypothetical protein
MIALNSKIIYSNIRCCVLVDIVERVCFGDVVSRTHFYKLATPMHIIFRF